MTELYGRAISKESLTRRIGHISQVAGARACTLTSGSADGAKAIDVKTGTGFEFTALPGRALDISWASFKGVPLGYISKSGVLNSALFNEDAVIGFQRSFFAGLLTTGGLGNTGGPSQVGDEKFGLHGRISNIAAEDVGVTQQWKGDDYEIRLAGTVRHATAFRECLLLRREIVTKLGANALTIRDVVENAGFRPEPIMLLYHCNFGYPILSGASRLYTSGGEVEPREPSAAPGLPDHDRFAEPKQGYAEQCFYHHLKGKDGRAYAALFNEELGVGAFVRYRADTLPLLVEWKMLDEQEYVVGLEPSTSRLDGRVELQRRNEVVVLAPGETRSFEVELGVLPDRAALAALK